MSGPPPPPPTDALRRIGTKPRGMVALHWPEGVCLSCGNIVNTETGEGHDAERDEQANVRQRSIFHPPLATAPAPGQGYSPMQPGNTYWRDTPLAEGLREMAGFPPAAAPAPGSPADALREAVLRCRHGNDLSVPKGTVLAVKSIAFPCGCSITRDATAAVPAPGLDALTAALHDAVVEYRADRVCSGTHAVGMGECQVMARTMYARLAGGAE